MSRRKSRKGVSPLVAVITLIAFTLIIAGFLANWATTFTTRQTQAIQECLGAEAIIQGATYSGNTLNLYVNNRGDLDLTFDVLLTLDDGSVTKEDNGGDGYAIDAGDLGTISISNVSDTLTEAAIESRECRSAQDFVGKSWINGL
jgi:flagellin-like protein